MLAAIAPELGRVARGISTLSLFLIDLDHFKEINDTHGHEAGDSVLREVAGAVRASVRSYDHCARWGGEEILVAAPGIGREGAGALAEKLRSVIAAVAVPSPAAEVLRVTCSVGACVVEPGESLDSSLARADRALYRAKAEGRNRWVLAEQPTAGSTP
jgi:diguanylate cyclase (GGDEF)-like protein